MIRRSVHALVLVLVVFALATVSAAQTDLGGLAGRITDPQGAVVPNAKVTITGVDNGFTRSVMSNNAGLYDIPALQAGNYHVTASGRGFQTTTTDTKVIVGQTITADFTLAVGAEKQQINVISTDSSVAVQTESHEMNQLVDSQELTQLPTNGRSSLAVALLGPGSQAGSDGNNAGVGSGGSSLFFGVIGNTVILSGQSQRTTTFLQDGVQNFNLLAESANILASVEATQEINTVTVGAQAKYDQPGLVNVITKSGGNSFHGAIYDFLQNDDLNATPFAAPNKTPIRNNVFGGDVSGPILRNKLFFLFDYTGTRLNNSAITRTRVPTDAERMGDFSGDGVNIYDPNTYNPVTNMANQFNFDKPNSIDPARESNFSKIYFGYFPRQTQPLDASNIDYIGTLTANTVLDEYLGRVDYNLNQRQHLMGTYARYTSNSTNPTISPGLFGIDYVNSGTNVSGEHTLALKRQLVNVIRFGYNQSNVQRSQQGAGAQPYLQQLGLTTLTPILPIEVPPLVSITGCCGLGDPYSPQGAIQNRFQFADEVDYQRGRHDFAMGGEYIYTRFDGKWTIINNGFYIFSPVFTSNPSDGTGGFGLADAFLGFPQIALAATGQPLGNYRQSQVSFYMQDDWKLAPKLVLNLGLRYQFTPAPQDALHRASYIDLAAGTTLPGTWLNNYGDIAPRFGFAWNPWRNTVVRGGYGIYYNSTPYNFLSFPVSNAGTGYAEQVDVYGYTTPTPVEQSILAHPAANLATPYTLGRVMKDPSVQQFNLDVEQSFAQHYLASLAYVGDLSRHQSVRINPNQATPVDPANITPITARRQYSGFGDVFAQYNIGNANYNAMQAKIERHFTNGLSLLVSYTWSKSMDFESEDGAMLTSRFNPRLDYAASDFDRTNQITTSAIYQLPFGPGHKFMNGSGWVDRDLVGGWQFSEITRFGTGQPVSVDDALSGAGTDTGGIQAPYYAQETCNPNVFPAGQHRSRAEWFNTACFRNPPVDSGIFGTARNVVRQPREDNVDLTATKSISFSAHSTPRLEIRADIFNLFNHPQLEFGEGAVGNPALGQLLSQNPYIPMRTIQMSARFSF